MVENYSYDKSKCDGLVEGVKWDVDLEKCIFGIREGIRKKIRNYLGIFPKCRTPPTPPFWEPLVQKKIYGLFCVLGPKEHF